MGDTLRDIGEMHVIKDDFLVVRGDIITNIDVQDALKQHYHTKQ
jgi:NDP-sugar pyrophosphorylase family protein